MQPLTALARETYLPSALRDAQTSDLVAGCRAQLRLGAPRKAKSLSAMHSSQGFRRGPMIPTRAVRGDPDLVASSCRRATWKSCSEHPEQIPACTACWAPVPDQQALEAGQNLGGLEEGWRSAEGTPAESLSGRSGSVFQEGRPGSQSCASGAALRGEWQVWRCRRGLTPKAFPVQLNQLGLRRQAWAPGHDSGPALLGCPQNSPGDSLPHHGLAFPVCLWIHLHAPSSPPSNAFPSLAVLCRHVSWASWDNMVGHTRPAAVVRRYTADHAIGTAIQAYTWVSASCLVFINSLGRVRGRHARYGCTRPPLSSGWPACLPSINGGLLPFQE